MATMMLLNSVDSLVLRTQQRGEQQDDRGGGDVKQPMHSAGDLRGAVGSAKKAVVSSGGTWMPSPCITRLK